MELRRKPCDKGDFPATSNGSSFGSPRPHYTGAALQAYSLYGPPLQERQILDQLCAPLQRRVLQSIGSRMVKELPLLQVRKYNSSSVARVAETLILSDVSLARVVCLACLPQPACLVVPHSWQAWFWVRRMPPSSRP